MAILGSLLIVGSFLIPAYQAYLWLTGGSWTPLSTDVLFSNILPNSFYVWLADDTSWVGLKEIVSRIVSDMSLFGFTFWSGLILILFDPSHKSYLRQTKARTDDNWDGRKIVRKLIEKTEPLRALYEKLGYSLYIESKSKQILEQLNSLIQLKTSEVTKSDIATIQVLLAVLQERFEKDNGKHEKESLSPSELEFYKKLIKNKDDSEKVLELLNENEIWKKSPFLYHDCLFISGHLVDKKKFLGLLDELEKVFQRWLPQPKEAYEDILYEIADLRREISEYGELSGNNLLSSLEDEIEEACVTLSHDEVAEERKRTIDNLLFELVYAKHTYEPRDSYMLDVAKEQAKMYLDSDWMHNPWLKTFILTCLLDGEIAPQQTAPIPEKFILVTVIGCIVLGYFKFHFLASACFVILIASMLYKYWEGFKIRGLQFVRGELISGVYDSEEIARRLRKLERWGIQVQSINYSLLRENPEIEKRLTNDKTDGRSES